jgi:hypothetical protein
MAVYPVRQAHALRHPDTGDYVVPRAGQPYPDDDPLVVAFPWAFCSAEALADAPDPRASLTEVPIERATARPGEKRRTPRTGGRR